MAITGVDWSKEIGEFSGEIARHYEEAKTNDTE